MRAAMCQDFHFLTRRKRENEHHIRGSFLSQAHSGSPAPSTGRREIYQERDSTGSLSGKPWIPGQGQTASRIMSSGHSEKLEEWEQTTGDWGAMGWQVAQDNQGAQEKVCSTQVSVASRSPNGHCWTKASPAVSKSTARMMPLSFIDLLFIYWDWFPHCSPGWLHTH